MLYSNHVRASRNLNRCRIRTMARQHKVAYVPSPRDRFAHHITRLAGDDVKLDEIQELLVALQRSGHLSRAEMVSFPSGLSARSKAVTFDPFGDFATRGYLRNLAKEKEPGIVRRLEHTSFFVTGIDAALARLANVSDSPTRICWKPIKSFSRPFILGPDKIGWRMLPTSRSAKAQFSSHARRISVERSNSRWVVGRTKHSWWKTLGDHGLLAYAHPFLDGNGRTIMVLHAVLVAAGGV